MKTTKKLLALLLLPVMVFTTIPFTASAANDYWGFDDYNTIEQPGAPEEITSYPTTVKKVSNSKYTMSSVMEGVGTIEISLIEETWGTFNLGNWILTTTDGKKYTFVDSSTDMEYVGTYYYNGTSATYSGGNHGGEALESLKLYDGESGKEIALAVGQSTTVNVLHVIEKTHLLNFPDANPADSINDYIDKNTPYTEDDIYANLTRKYTFTGPQIKLNVDWVYAKDSYQAKIYACMFPINKNYGYYCDMIDQNGAVIKTIATRPYGDTSIPNYAGSHNSGNEATRAVIYSPDYPNFQFDIRVNTLEDSLNGFRDAFYKTSYWDMNSGANKLYFSRYDEGQKILHKKGTEVHTECIWLFRYADQARQPSESETPVSRGKSYTNDVDMGSAEYNTSYGAKLTDGVVSDSFNMGNDSWYAFFSGGDHPNAPNQKGEVIIDLEEEYVISKVKAHLANVSNMGVGAPASVKVSASSDNKDFVEIATLTTQSAADAIYWTEAAVTNEVVARYVKFEFTLNGAFAYVNELEVYGAKPVEPEDPNLALGLDYTISGTNDPIVSEQWNTDYSAKLTDGIAADEYHYNGGNWFMFSASYANTSGGKGTVTVDLKKISKITKFKVHLIANTREGVKAPKEINVYVSTDGKNYTLAGKIPPEASTINGYWAELKVDNLLAGSVRFEFVLDGSYCVLNEIEVRGIETDEAYAPLALGDIDGNGTVNSTDYLYLKRAVLGTYPLTDRQIAVADINKDGKINSTDYLYLKRAVLGTYTIK